MKQAVSAKPQDIPGILPGEGEIFDTQVGPMLQKFCKELSALTGRTCYHAAIAIVGLDAKEEGEKSAAVFIATNDTFGGDPIGLMQCAQALENSANEHIKNPDISRIPEVKTN